ncbi:hypothetical protein PR202_gb21696 [Eleusine coracana subsp. coracana]|uniref:DUF6598 domain-containing protein n=1 Tax=Eleusine coracana subsp. coracana TaxID=191504 RepID=A0AAV5FBS8_ELECO|nr:hypothetical protein PR202_gb21696 [Eleusine coracana subsp. coracana]
MNKDHLPVELNEAGPCLLSEDEYDDDDEPGFHLRRFRERWDNSWSGADGWGDFDDTTLIPPMRYTRDGLSCGARRPDTTQIFSVKIAGIGEGLQWPLDVFGHVDMRDCIDRNRNIIFCRSRVDCQTLTDKDPNLLLTGPTRPVVLLDPVFIEVDLKVKGALEDKTLFCRVLPLTSPEPIYSRLLGFAEVSKFSTLEFTLGHIIFSLEATISVRVVNGSWPDGFHGQFSACTTRSDHDSVGETGPVIDGADSVNHMEILLLGFGSQKGPLIDDRGKIALSRRVVCVQDNSKLEVSVKACRDDSNIVVDRAGFTTKESGKSYGKLEVASCKMEVSVAWSMVSSIPELRRETILKNSLINV